VTTAAPLGPEHAAARRLASAVPSITTVRISPPGFEATLIDISESGLLVECGSALKLGQIVTVEFEGTFSPQSVEAQVIRSAVASMTSEGIRYEVGLSFAASIALGDAPPLAPTVVGTDAAATALANPSEPDDIENRW